MSNGQAARPAARRAEARVPLIGEGEQRVLGAENRDFGSLGILDVEDLDLTLDDRVRCLTCDAPAGA